MGTVCTCLDDASVYAIRNLACCLLDYAICGLHTPLRLSRFSSCDDSIDVSMRYYDNCNVPIAA